MMLMDFTARSSDCVLEHLLDLISARQAACEVFFSFSQGIGQGFLLGRNFVIDCSQVGLAVRESSFLVLQRILQHIELELLLFLFALHLSQALVKLKQSISGTLDILDSLRNVVLAGLDDDLSLVYFAFTNVGQGLHKRVDVVEELHEFFSHLSRHFNQIGAVANALLEGVFLNLGDVLVPLKFSLAGGEGLVADEQVGQGLGLQSDCTRDRCELGALQLKGLLNLKKL